MTDALGNAYGNANTRELPQAPYTKCAALKRMFHTVLAVLNIKTCNFYRTFSQPPDNALTPRRRGTTQRGGAFRLGTSVRLLECSWNALSNAAKHPVMAI